MRSNKSGTRVQCFPLVWTPRNNYARTGTRPFKREWRGYEQKYLSRKTPKLHRKLSGYIANPVTGIDLAGDGAETVLKQVLHLVVVGLFAELGNLIANVSSPIDVTSLVRYCGE
ncbi:hypothetical protein T265_08490 [Opisthorchis viverrini]|uniref:Uncharacterized protein n=1 Tax=Opisthorchis viverrini TaxID=6198 RepID=A0A074Z916_OPIVI|nr:hypothetical protein T265_08490 [Opisthorchis viverrini]KER23681.1 hypothetical protein T265_08490 [Opisthorchis viverrini]